MEILDTAEGKKSGTALNPESHSSTDRFVATRRFEEREEEEKVEAAMALYEQAARARIQRPAQEPSENTISEEEREAQSQRLKLQQKCQDIAALIMVVELEDEEE